MSTDATSSNSPLFVYGIADPTESSSGITLDAIYPPASGMAQSSPRRVPIASDLETRPVRSPDGRFICAIKSSERVGATDLIVSIIDASSGIEISSGTVTLSDCVGNAVLITPVFTSDGQTIASVLSISVPIEQHEIQKIDPRTGDSFIAVATKWTTHHELIFSDSASGSISGPFDLGNAPTLAVVDAVANRDSLFLWTLDDTSALPKTKGQSIAPSSPRLTVYPVGSGTPRLSVTAPGDWPTGTRSVVALPSGEVVRLVAGRRIQTYSPGTGTVSEQSIPWLDVTSAKSSVIDFSVLPTGHLLIGKSAIGRAVILDPTDSSRELHRLEFPRPKYPFGAPISKGAFSTSAGRLYVLGDGTKGGVTAYDIQTGATVVSGGEGDHYVGLCALTNGMIAAVGSRSTQLDFFDSTLKRLATSETQFFITGLL